MPVLTLSIWAMKKPPLDYRSERAPALVDAPFGTIDDLETLYRRYRNGIHRYVARTFGPGPPDPEDVVQVAFEKYAALDETEKITNPPAFLFRSARNYVIDQRRQLSVRAEYARDVVAVTSYSDDLDGARVLESKQRWAVLEAAIARLDARSREMLLMNRIHGLSSAEIARRNGCSPTLVKTIIARALVACHRALAEPD